MAAGGDLVVYVLDDDEPIRTGLCRLLRAAGLRERGCGSVDELLAALAAGGPACVLFDLSLQRRAASPLGASLRRHGFDVPTIAISGLDDARAAADARAGGASLLFRKPVDGRALLDAIAWVTARPASLPQETSTP